MFEDRCYDRDNTINTNFTGDKHEHVECNVKQITQ